MQSDRTDTHHGYLDGTTALDGTAIGDSVFDDPTGFDPDELREFLAADLMDDVADPEFKERLRNKLWKMVRLRYGWTSGRPS